MSHISLLASENSRAVDVWLERQTSFMCFGGVTSWFTLLSLCTAGAAVKKTHSLACPTQRLKNNRKIKRNFDTSKGLIVLSISNIYTFNML